MSFLIWNRSTGVAFMNFSISCFFKSAYILTSNNMLSFATSTSANRFRCSAYFSDASLLRLVTNGPSARMMRLGNLLSFAVVGKLFDIGVRDFRRNFILQEFSQLEFLSCLLYRISAALSFLIFFPLRAEISLH